MRLDIRVDFLHHNIRDTVVIPEERNLLHPWLTCCDMMVPWAALNGHHTTTSQCAKGAEQKRHHLEAERMRVSMARAFQAYG